jgi:hypothetical protein
MHRTLFRHGGAQQSFRFSIFFVTLTKVRVQLFQIIRHARA